MAVTSSDWEVELASIARRCTDLCGPTPTVLSHAAEFIEDWKKPGIDAEMWKSYLIFINPRELMLQLQTGGKAGAVIYGLCTLQSFTPGSGGFCKKKNQNNTIAFAF